MIAATPSDFPVRSVLTEKRSKTPKIVTAEIALVIDINGACNNGGTRDISRYPMRKELMNTKSIISSSSIFLHSHTLLRKQTHVLLDKPHRLDGSLEHNFSLMGNERMFDDIVVQIGRIQTSLKEIFYIVV